MSEQISVEDAFRAMVIFLDRYYDRGGGVDTLGDILSAISQTIWADGSPNDPAQWQDWLDAIKEAKK
ncbi:hypothetical protein [Paraburkholderia heleia]|uniref:hypothetical protein n=1 Tax=Paraburkholderia heleia TaxID=634127 RepID=UPI0005A946F1|nr:hypothetical protein [Paraburkholderia heleia]